MKYFLKNGLNIYITYFGYAKLQRQSSMVLRFSYHLYQRCLRHMLHRSYNLFYFVYFQIEGARIAHKLSQTRTMSKIKVRLMGRPYPGCAHTGDPLSDEALECHARHHTLTIYHPVGTCKMAPSTDPMAVVDSRLKARITLLKG